MAVPLLPIALVSYSNFLQSTEGARPRIPDDKASIRVDDTFQFIPWPLVDASRVTQLKTEICHDIRPIGTESDNSMTALATFCNRKASFTKDDMICNSDSLGTGQCRLFSVHNIFSHKAEGLRRGMLLTDIIRNCAHGLYPVIPETHAYETAGVGGSRQLKAFLPSGFKKNFPGLYEADHRGLYVIENFLSPEEVETAREVVRQTPGHPMGWHKARLAYQNDMCSFQKSDARTLENELSDKLRFFHERAMALTGLPRENVESFFAHTYKQGGFISDHADEEPCEKDIEEGVFTHAGDRITEPATHCNDPTRRYITILTFLTDILPGSGGATHFLDLGLRVLPKRGRALVFFPTFADKTYNPFLRHAGEDSFVHEREILQLWMSHGATHTGREVSRNLM